MQTWMIVVIVLIALAVIAAVGWTIWQRQRTERLTERYGPEYERTVEQMGDRSEAERELASREKRVKEYEIRDLSPEARADFADRWRETQAEFVDDPSGAISRADHLVQEVMQARGYPMADFDQRAADVSVDHPQVVEEYRAAHAIAERHASGGADTEDLRTAMVHYRALFNELLGSEIPEQREPVAGARR